jgi:hypothetical protein
LGNAVFVGTVKLPDQEEDKFEIDFRGVPRHQMAKLNLEYGEGKGAPSCPH